jgi:hypothetical protein
MHCNKAKLITGIVVFILVGFAISSFAFMLEESIIISNVSSVKDTCGYDVYAIIVYCTIEHTLEFLYFTIVSILIAMTGDFTYMILNKVLTTTVTLVMIGVDIWKLYVYYSKLSKECIDMLNNDYSDLWRVFSYEVDIIYVSFSIFGLLILAIIIWACIFLSTVFREINYEPSYKLSKSPTMSKSVTSSNKSNVDISNIKNRHIFDDSLAVELV